MHVNIFGFSVDSDDRVEATKHAAIGCATNITLNIGPVTLWVTPAKLREIATKTAALADEIEGKDGK